MLNLSTKEAEILPLVVRGKRNKQIASKLYIANETVKAHVGSIMKKLKVQNRTEIAYYVFKNKIINIDELE